MELNENAHSMNTKMATRFIGNSKQVNKKVTMQAKYALSVPQTNRAPSEFH